MNRTITTTTVVQPGGRIELISPELPIGAEVDVTIVERNGQDRRSVSEILRGYAGGSLFQSAAEVDAYLDQERDSWSR